MKELIEQKRQYILEKLKRNQALYGNFDDNFINNIMLKEQFITETLDSFDILTYDKIEKWANLMNTMLDNDYQTMLNKLEGKRGL